MDLKKFKPNKKVMYFTGAIVLGIMVLLTSYSISTSIFEKELAAKLAEEAANAAATSAIVQTPIETPAPTTPAVPAVINFQQYNYRFAEKNVEGILSSMLGSTGKFAIYLPPTKYINISKGTNFGVAFALKNPVSSGQNYFEYSWTADDSVIENCGVSKSVADKWMDMGASSFGINPVGLIVSSTVYFKFPEDMTPCNLKYNFIVTKDNLDFATSQIEFNIL